MGSRTWLGERVADLEGPGGPTWFEWWIFVAAATNCQSRPLDNRMGLQMRCPVVVPAVWRSCHPNPLFKTRLGCPTLLSLISHRSSVCVYRVTSLLFVYFLNTVYNFLNECSYVGERILTYQKKNFDIWKASMWLNVILRV